MLPFIELVPANEREAFTKEVIRVSKSIGTRPEFLMYIMKHESGISASVQNSIGATGLIQFMPQTAGALGYTTSQLKGMSRTEQLKVVEKYYYPYRFKNLSDFTNLSLVTFYPVAVGKPDSYIIGSEKSEAWAKKVSAQNKIFDLNKNGLITIAEYREYLKKKFPDAFKLSTGFFLPDSSQEKA